MEFYKRESEIYLLHTKFKMPLCFLCSKSFSRLDSLKRHNQSVHHDTVHKEMPLKTATDSSFAAKEQICHIQPIQNSTGMHVGENYDLYAKELNVEKS